MPKQAAKNSENIGSFSEDSLPFHTHAPEDSLGGERLVERGEETGSYSFLRENLRTMQAGGVDIHFSRIDLDNLSIPALDLYRKFTKKQLTEKDLKNFKTENNDEDNFVALLRTWLIEEVAKKKVSEREKRG